MKGTFICIVCDKIFDAEPRKIEYMDYTYGPCAKYVSDCPVCGEQCSEYRKPKPAKKEYSIAPPACGNPGGCCRNCNI